MVPSEPGDDDLTTVTACMQELAGEPIGAAPIPSAALIWWKAEARRRWSASARAAAPIEIAEQVQIVLLPVAALALVWFAPLATPALTRAVGIVAAITLLASTAALVAARRRDRV